MAARRRDYAREERRRNELAREQQYSSRAQQRRYREAGITAPKPEADRELERKRRESAEWSRNHSHSSASRYRPTMSSRHVADYHAAWVRKYAHREQQTAARKHWLVDVIEWGPAVEAYEDQGWY